MPDRKSRGGPRKATGTRKANVQRRGWITLWQPGASWGLATDDGGLTWFVSRDDLPAGRTELDWGTAITFQGTTRPSPGKGYPRAYGVQVEEDPVKMGDG